MAAVRYLYANGVLVADELYSFNCTIPAGTPVSAPVTIPMSMPARIVRRITTIVARGPGDNMGFRVAVNGTQVIPVNNGAWLVEDDERNEWDRSGDIQSGAWQIVGYNTGVYPHTVTVRFEVDLPWRVGGGQPLPLAL